METQRGQIRTMIPDKIMNLKAYGMIENYETKDFPGEITMTKNEYDKPSDTRCHPL